jgi:hypothetical protein
LLEARLEILSLLLLFVCNQHFIWVLGQIELGVHISDADVNDTICASCSESAYQHVSSIFALVLAKVAKNRVIWRFKVVLRICGATGKDFGFVVNCGREESLGRQVTQLVLYLIVT